MADRPGESHEAVEQVRESLYGIENNFADDRTLDFARGHLDDAHDRLDRLAARLSEAERELAYVKEAYYGEEMRNEETYWLRAKLRGAITHLRDVEDYYRVQGFNMIRADRARDLYEAITEDFVNGSRERPITRADLERRVAQLEEALRELQGAGVVVWHQASVGSGQVDIGPLDELADALAAAGAVLAGGTPPPGTADSGDSRAVVAEEGRDV